MDLAEQCLDWRQVSWGCTQIGTGTRCLALGFSTWPLSPKDILPFRASLQGLFPSGRPNFLFFFFWLRPTPCRSLSSQTRKWNQALGSESSEATGQSRNSPAWFSLNGSPGLQKGEWKMLGFLVARWAWKSQWVTFPASYWWEEL